MSASAEATTTFKKCTLHSEALSTCQLSARCWSPRNLPSLRAGWGEAHLREPPSSGLHALPF